MAKHDRAHQEKKARNLSYAVKYLHKKCVKCGNKSSKVRPCAVCGGDMK